MSLTYRTAQGTAAVGTDYQGLAAQALVFAPGERAKTIAVNLIDDGIREDGEHFDLLLSEGSGVLLPDTRGRAYIGASDQSAGAVPVFSVADTVVNESAGFADFILRLDAPQSEPVSVEDLSVQGQRLHAWVRWLLDVRTGGYIASYPDLTNAFGANADAGASHYIQAGRFEGRAVSFDGLGYIASYGDLINAFHDQVAVDPYPTSGPTTTITAGYFENRAADRFDAGRYLANYADLRSVFGTNTQAATASLHHRGDGVRATPPAHIEANAPVSEGVPSFRHRAGCGALPYAPRSRRAQ